MKNGVSKLVLVFLFGALSWMQLAFSQGIFSKNENKNESDETRLNPKQ